MSRHIQLSTGIGTRWALRCVAVGMAAAAACSPFVYEAEFSVRPGTVRPADLLGPYTGQVLDAPTGRPVKDALVMASWEFVQGTGFVVPGGSRTWFGRTDRDGRYRVPRLTDLPTGPTRAVARFRLLVYRRGWVAYRSDRIFPGDLPRTDFFQKGNTVRLERFTEEMSHAEHVRFIGRGAGPLARATAWEVQAAVAALSPQAGRMGQASGDADSPGHSGPLLDASDLLDVDDIQAVTRYTGPFTLRRMTDVPRSTYYDSQHFQAQGKQSQRFDAAYRVWSIGSRAERHYERLRAAYPNPKPTDELGDRAFRSANRDVLALVWWVKDRGVVVSFTCGRDLCKTPAVLLRLARLLHGRLGQIHRETPEPARPLGPTINPFRPVSPRAPVLR